jgi:hypothetical protein
MKESENVMLRQVKKSNDKQSQICKDGLKQYKVRFVQSIWVAELCWLSLFTPTDLQKINSIETSHVMIGCIRFEIM